MKSIIRKRLFVKGIVQGVGFRPFIYRLANQLNIKGWVLNSSAGVTIEAEGKGRAVNEFIERIQNDKPANARIDLLKVWPLGNKGYRHFTIRESTSSKNGQPLISPDLATCGECQKDLDVLHSRRYNYPFTNCTNCGPRYSIISSAPYDRVWTTMKAFRMCKDCDQEYHNMFDRRFHAQPNACSICGPRLFLYDVKRRPVRTDSPLEETVRLLKRGKIVAIKGIGGFHIACDARNEQAVRRLRLRKSRPHKPFALMAKLQDIRRVAHLYRAEIGLLATPQAPIVLLRKKKNRILCQSIAPGNPYLGMMLPYTPLHHLLFQKLNFLVMTSGNIQDEPIVIDDKECFDAFSSIVDYVLVNNRSIQNRSDDSILYYSPVTNASLLRRSRGYAPDPIDLPVEVKPTLACGGELKGTFCLARKKEAYLSPHLGDMENIETMSSFKQTLALYERWFRFRPDVIAHDLHPDYMTTRFALSMDHIKKVPVQHHFAHIASCLAENLVEEEAIGLAFDGTGYGTDGKIWGCEFLIGNVRHLKRVGHLMYIPLPGGEASIRHPYRIGISYLTYLLGSVPNLPFVKKIRADEVKAIEQMVKSNFNLVYTSSLGRLFDAVAAILGVMREITFEAQAAMQLEYLATAETRDSYPAKIRQGQNLAIDPTEILLGIVQDIRKGRSLELIATKFHNSVLRFSLELCKILRAQHHVNRVALSGGAFQNRRLLDGLYLRLKQNGFVPIFHHKVPCNDGGISLGQVVLANSI